MGVFPFHVPQVAAVMEAVTVVMVTVIVATVVATRVAVVEGTIETGKNLVPFFIRHAFSTFVNQYLLILV